jgi:outer membrane protein assembly factor BamE (lipoprotein component of BamABCDE complex)
MFSGNVRLSDRIRPGRIGVDAVPSIPRVRFPGSEGRLVAGHASRHPCLRASLAAGIGFAAMFLTGCMSSGTKMDRQQIDHQITKGVTTRSEVEANLGTPDHVAMMPDGHRSLSYQYFDSKIKGTSFIPYAGMFMGGADHQRQTLQVLIDKNNVVEDYEFAEKATETSSNPFGSHTTEVPAK